MLSRFGVVFGIVCWGLQSPTIAQIDGEVIRLWPGGAPGFEDRRDESEEAESYWVRNIHHPSLTAFFPQPEKSTGAAVIICPGGGHRLLVYQAEGVAAAKFLAEIGVTAFVLKYRLGREEDSPYDLQIHAREDGQRAVRLVRSRAAEWGLDPARIGMLGFSAGGEVVSMVSYSKGDGQTDSDDLIERVSARPDFQILVYPGPLGIPDVIGPDAPPAFFAVTSDDKGSAGTVLRTALALQEQQIPVEVHMYARGGHAFNMGQRTKLGSLRVWPERMHQWMQDSGLLSAREASADGSSGK